MNEDARDEDSVTGRALGTLALIGASAFGVGFGVRSVMKASKKVTQGTKKMFNSAKQTVSGEMLRRDVNRMQDVVAGDITKLKLNETFYGSAEAGNKVVLKRSSQKGIFLPAQEDELIEAGAPIKKSIGRRNREMRDQMKEEAQARTEETVNRMQAGSTKSNNEAPKSSSNKPQQEPVKEVVQEPAKTPSGNKQQNTSTDYRTYSKQPRNPFNVSNEDYTDLSNVKINMPKTKQEVTPNSLGRKKFESRPKQTSANKPNSRFEWYDTLLEPIPIGSSSAYWPEGDISIIANSQTNKPLARKHNYGTKR